MKRTGIILIICGALLLAGAAGWSTLAVSSLVKFPLNTNTTLHYDGRFATFVDASTGAALAKPTSVPLAIDRTIRALPTESSSSVAVVQEQIVLHYSGKAVDETNVYALNRSSMQNVASDHASTFAPANPAPAVGSYYVTLPMNSSADATTLRIWKPETGTTYPLVPLRAGTQPSDLDGVNLTWFSATLPMTAVASYERTALASRGLPLTVSPAVVEADLSAAGVPVASLTKTLLPKLSPAQLTEVGTILTARAQLNYYAFGSGLVGANPRTGAIVELKSVIDGIAVAPATSGLSSLVSIMSHYTSVKGVPAAMADLRRFAAAPPQRVYELQYSQTASSIANMASVTKSQLGQISIVTYYVPIALAVAGVLLVLLAALRFRRRGEPVVAGLPTELGRSAVGHDAPPARNVA
jgi:hypothetical protein